MQNAITHLVINWIAINDNSILVGATDNERWQWDTEEGASGADAKTLVTVTLTQQNKGFSTLETANFYCPPGDITRSVVMLYIEELFRIAWAIKNKNLDFTEAHKIYFGKALKSKES